MLTILMISAGVVLIAGGVLSYCVVHAPDGHESPDGFHFGEEPVMRRRSAKSHKSSRSTVPAGKFHLPAV